MSRATYVACAMPAPQPLQRRGEERLSGRGVTAFIADSHIGPDIEIELFMLTAPSNKGFRG